MKPISSPPPASAEIIVNENFAAILAFFAYARNPDTSSGLTWGYYGGRWGGFLVTAGTLTLTNGVVNYVVVARATGAITSSTTITNWNNLGDFARAFQLTTAGSVVTVTTDHRAGLGGVHGQMPPPPSVTVASAATIAIALGQRVVVISGTTGISSVTATGHTGAAVTLVFQGALTVTDGSNLRLAGNFITTADDSLSLVCDGTNWFEVGRSVN